MVGLIVALDFQVLPDINLGGDPTVFYVHGFLPMIVIIFLIVSLVGFLTSSARKSSKLRFKSVVAVGGLTMLIPVLGITIGASGSEPLWQFCLVGSVGGVVWSVPFAIADSKPA